MESFLLIIIFLFVYFVNHLLVKFFINKYVQGSLTLLISLLLLISFVYMIYELIVDHGSTFEGLTDFFAVILTVGLGVLLLFSYLSLRRLQERKNQKK